ncbi:thioesterase family protein [Purpureocillium lavendulum]|uniref:Thioesterase family protein n=1 Tax=Purpureocillium lavendulum TaxID=1247861 RepID=A0AB34FY04_9HYPO|nr:thioesterase family protein [Purpureocillium lavendulum]
MANDNDMYDHMNNSVYNFLFDSAVNAYLMEHCSLHPPNSAQHPLVAHTSTDFFASIAYPAVAEVGVRVAKLGRSSVTYEVAVFERGADAVRAVGSFVHVFVERATGRPHPDGMAPELRSGLERLLVRDGRLQLVLDHLAVLFAADKHLLEKLEVGERLLGALQRVGLAARDAVGPGGHLVADARDALKDLFRLVAVLGLDGDGLARGAHPATLVGHVPLKGLHEGAGRVLEGAGGAAGGADDGGDGVDGWQARLDQVGGGADRGGAVGVAAQEEAGGGGVVDAAVEQEAALVAGLLAPGRLVVLVFGAHVRHDLDGEVRDAAHGDGLLGGVGEARDEAEVLGDAEGAAGGGALGVVRRDEVARGRHVLGDGLLGQDVLARGEGRLDDARLREDGQRHDDGGDVVAREDVDERPPGAGVLGEQLRLRGDPVTPGRGRVRDEARDERGGRLGRREGARVDGAEG